MSLDFKEIQLLNERSGHVTKRLNRLNGWQFFKVLYRDDFIKIVLSNLLMLVFLVPTILVYYFSQSASASVMATLPYVNAFGVGASVWTGMGDYLTTQSASITAEYNLWFSLALLSVSVIFSGGMAIVRDSFWTGKLKVIKTFFVGIATNIPYTLFGTIILSAMYYGIVTLQAFLLATIPAWVAIIIVVIAYIIMAFTGMYLFTMFSVTVTFKQSFANNVKDSWLLLFMNFLPNVIHFVLAIAPLALLFFLSSSIMSTIIMVFYMLIGVFYIVFVWMTHMMRTFALFYPVVKSEK